MKHSTKKPPVWDEVASAFGLEWDESSVLVYGDTIHSFNSDLPHDVVAHEEVHIAQQARIGADAWWKMYIESPDFRLKQEVEAYRAQLAYIQKFVKDRNEILRMKRRLALYLSGPMYGCICSFSEAMRLIS